MESHKLEQGRFSESPDRAVFRDKVLEFDDATAIAFCFINDRCVVTARQGVHHDLFESLLALKSSVESAKVLKKQGRKASSRLAKSPCDGHISTSPRATEADLAWFFAARGSGHGWLHRKVHAGRGWINIRDGGETVSFLSFWTLARETRDHVILRIVEALGCEGKVLFEFADSLTRGSLTVRARAE